MKRFAKRAVASILSIVTISLSLLNLCGCDADIKEVFRDRRLNLDGYELSFCDEFNGNALDTSVWDYRKTGARRNAFLHPDQVSVSGGKLIITGEYTNGEFGEGWYAGMIALREMYTYGYYEIRCLPNEGEDFWSAFWLFHPDCYTHEKSQGGIYGAEIDIFETYKNHTITTKEYVASTIHCNGSDDDTENIDSARIAKTFVPNLRTEFHTFGLMWTENEYIFYVDGYETGRTSFGNGTSTVGEQVIVSLEPPDEIHLDKSDVTKFYVDYVKIYAPKNPI